MKTTKIMAVLTLLTVSAITLPVDKHTKPSEQKVKPGETGAVKSLFLGAIAPAVVLGGTGLQLASTEFSLIGKAISLAVEQVTAPINTLTQWSSDVVDYFTTGEGRSKLESFSTAERAAFALGNTLTVALLVKAWSMEQLNPLAKVALLTTLIPSLATLIGSYAALPAPQS